MPTRRLRRQALADVPERFIRLATAFLVPCFGAIAVIATFSPEGPHTTTRRIIVGLIFLTTIPVGIGIARMYFGRVWRPHPLRRSRLGPILFVVYADIGVSAVLFTFANHATALYGTALFAIIGAFTASFTSRAVVLSHIGVTSVVITTLAVLTWRQGNHDIISVIARWLTSLLSANAVLLMLNAFTRGMQKSFDTQLDNATRDSLTGLLNRRGLELWAEHVLSSRLTRIDFILVDLDRFKTINDTHGHAAGDEVLVLAGRRLAAAVGDHGLLARTGGEEFTVLMTDCDSGELSHAIRAAVHDPDDEIPITASVGVATLTFDDITRGDAADALREGPRRADIALYQAKRAGRNRVQTYPSPPKPD